MHRVVGGARAYLFSSVADFIINSFYAPSWIRAHHRASFIVSRCDNAVWLVDKYERLGTTTVTSSPSPTAALIGTKPSAAALSTVESGSLLSSVLNTNGTCKSKRVRKAPSKADNQKRNSYHVGLLRLLFVVNERRAKDLGWNKKTASSLNCLVLVVINKPDNCRDKNVLRVRPHFAFL